MDRALKAKGPAPATRVAAIELERFCGTPLGDLRIVCRGCSSTLSALDKLAAINKGSTVWWTRGTLHGYCYCCTEVTVV